MRVSLYCWHVTAPDAGLLQGAHDSTWDPGGFGANKVYHCRKQVSGQAAGP